MPPSLLPVPDLDTARLRLRCPRSEDVAAVQALADDWEVAQWMSRLPHPYREADARLFIDEVAPAEPCWAITDRGDGSVFGVIGLTLPTSSGPAEFGYWLGRRCWGQGLATEAGGAVVAHAFGAAGLFALRSGHFAGNARSARVLSKLGFVASGSSRRASLGQNAILDHVDMMLTREAWLGRQFAIAREATGSTRTT